MTVFPQPIVKFVAKSANYTASPGDYVNVTTGTETIAITLPAAATGATVQVRKVDAAAGKIKLVTEDGSTIDGVAGATGIETSTSRHAGFTVASDGSNYWVVGS